jgi:hypothetical protein
VERAQNHRPAREGGVSLSIIGIGGISSGGGGWGGVTERVWLVRGGNELNEFATLVSYGYSEFWLF